MNADERRCNEIGQRIIGCAYRVSHEPGCGFLETVYKRAMPVEPRHAGADILVEDAVILELKAVKQLDSIHSAQCINYMRATG